MKKLILATMLALPLLAQAAPSWVHVTGDSEDTYFIDTNTIRTTQAGVKTAWVKRVAVDGERAVSLNRTSCNARTMQILQTTWYLPTGGNHHDSQPARVSNVIPGSIGENLLEAICK